MRRERPLQKKVRREGGRGGKQDVWGKERDVYL